MNNIRFVTATALCVAAAIAPAAASAAVTPAYEYNSSSTLNEARPFTLGFKFSLAQAATVDALGYWSANLSSQQVGLWTDTGTLLASATLDSTDPLTGHYRWQSISSLALGAGTYVIGGTFTGGNFPFELQGVTSAAGYTWLGDAQVQGSGLLFPSISEGGFYGQNGIGLVNFSFASGNAVPEPATWAMMLIGFGAIGATMRRRTRASVRLSAA